MSVHDLLTNSGPLIGYIILFAIVFAESGLLIGFFLPGDTLLLGAGVIAAGNYFNIWVVIAICFAAAVIGDSVGYAIGKYYGPKLFSKEDSIFFHKDHLAKAEHFYEKHGKKTIILARFVPIIRTFAPTVAGIGSMNYRTFLSYNLIGAFLWTASITLVGFFVTKAFPQLEIEKYLEPVIIAVVVLSIIPAVYHLIKEQIKARKQKDLDDLTS